MNKDISVNDTGGYLVSGGDFTIVSSEECDKQAANVRIKTTNSDYYYQPQIGADLTDLFGEPNTQETGARGESYIVRSLSYDGRFSTYDIDTDSVPTSLYSILFRIDLNTSRKLKPTVPLLVGLYLKSGVLV